MEERFISVRPIQHIYEPSRRKIVISEFAPHSIDVFYESLRGSPSWKNGILRILRVVNKLMSWFSFQFSSSIEILSWNDSTDTSERELLTKFLFKKIEENEDSPSSTPTSLSMKSLRMITNIFTNVSITIYWSHQNFSLSEEAKVNKLFKMAPAIDSCTLIDGSITIQNESDLESSQTNSTLGIPLKKKPRLEKGTTYRTLEL